MSKTLAKKIIKITYIVGLIFGFLASMATALDPAFNDTSMALGTVAFVLTLLFIGFSGIDLVATVNFKKFAEFRKGEKGEIIEIVIKGIVGFTIIFTTILSLILA